MSVQQRSKRRNREVTGPTPHSVAVIARQPSSRPPDYLTIERRRQEAVRNDVLEYTNDHKACSVRINWENNTNKRLLSATIQRRAHEELDQYERRIEERRERLRKKLESEEKQMLEEMETKKNNILERQARMRERAKYLQEKRESERQKLVAEKRDQLFREQSEELRAMWARKHLEEVCMDRAAQIQTCQEERRLQQEEEKIFAQLWDGDRLAKEQRANLQAQHQKNNNLQQLAFLQSQMDAAEQQRLQAKQLKKEEGQLMREQNEMMRLEAQREYRQMLKDQENRRKELDTSLRLKMKRLAQAQQDDLALDMTIMEQLLSQVKDEKKEENLRKKELCEENHRYRRYLADELEEQRQREAEKEKLIDAELQQTLKCRAEQNRKMKEAKDQMMKDVLDTQCLQIQEKLQKNAQKQAELAKESDELKTTIQENKQLDEQEKSRLREASQEHQADLLAQILYKQQLCDVQQAEMDQVVQNHRLYLKQYDKLVQESLSKPTVHTKAIHPFRRRDHPTVEVNSNKL